MIPPSLMKPLVGLVCLGLAIVAFLVWLGIHDADVRRKATLAERQQWTELRDRMLAKQSEKIRADQARIDAAERARLTTQQQLDAQGDELSRVRAELEDEADVADQQGRDACGDLPAASARRLRDALNAIGR